MTPNMAGPGPAEPEIDLEDVFRKKLLELERRGQEIEKEAYGRGFAQGEKDGLEYGRKSAAGGKCANRGNRKKSWNALPEEIYPGL